VLIASVGCDVVKVGTKCRAGAAPGRDATHLVLCQKGRWTKSLTLQETANILAGLQPKTAEVVAGNEQSAVVGTFFAKAIEVKVTRANGSPAADAKVALSPPATGASLALFNASATTNASGVALFLATPNRIAGSYEVTAKVAGKDVSTTIKLTNTAAAAKNVTVASGGGQSAVVDTAFANPIGLKVTDEFGNPVAGVVPIVTSPNVQLPSDPTSGTISAPAASNAAGLTSIMVKAPQRSGTASITAAAGATTTASAVTFTLQVKPGDADSYTLDPATLQSAAVSSAFPLPFKVRLLDQFGNGVPAVTMTFEAPASGPSAALSAPSAITGADGIASVTATANATAGTYNLFVTIVGYDQQSSIEFDLENL